MPAVVDEAIVLRVWEFSETSQTAALFTRSHGPIRVIAKGSRRPRAAFSGGLDMLTRGEAVWHPRASSALATLAEWDLRDMFWAVRRNRACHAVGTHVADLAARLVHDHDPHPVLFDALGAALSALGPAARPDVVLLRFQWAALRDTGFAPEIWRDLSTGAPLPPSPAYEFDPRRAALRVVSRGLPAGGGGGSRWRVRPATVEALRWADAGADNPAPAPDAVGRAVRLLGSHLSNVLGVELATLSHVLGELRESSPGASNGREDGPAPLRSMS